ncbi:MAG: tetratricopeptide repeat protein [Rhizobiales bacterium]|nr:tetratricopeptide repeat protein [Hyphomicrobiales bacterium]
MTDTIEQAEALIKSGQAREALTVLEEIVAANPTFLRAHSACAAAHLKLGNRDKAVEHLKEFLPAIDQFPNPVRARIGIAGRFAEAGGFDQADKLLEQAMEMEPDNLEILVKRADTLADAKRWADALTLYRQALDELPDHPELLTSAGIAAQKADELADAAEYYEQVLRQAPDDVVVYHNLVAALTELGRLGDALEVCREWLVQKPDDIDGMAFQALLLVETGRVDEAATWFDFDRLVHSYMIDVPAAYKTLDGFNRALESEILAHPELETPPEDHPTWHHPALKIGSHINAAGTGAIHDLEAVMHDAVERYYDNAGDADGHPFLVHRPKKYRIEPWAAVLEREGNQQPHIHMDGYLSGCYYITIPPEVSADENGADGLVKGGFEIGRPPEEITITADLETRTIKPLEGLMVLFPAYMYHGTIPFKSDQRRICIAFDVMPEE